MYTKNVSNRNGETKRRATVRYEPPENTVFVNGITTRMTNDAANGQSVVMNKPSMASKSLVNHSVKHDKLRDGKILNVKKENESNAVARRGGNLTPRFDAIGLAI